MVAVKTITDGDPKQRTDPSELARAQVPQEDYCVAHLIEIKAADYRMGANCSLHGRCVGSSAKLRIRTR